MISYYQIIFVAPQNPISQAEVEDTLAHLYQTSKARIQRVLQQPYPVLKRAKNLSEAQKYQQVLEQYGIHCEIRADTPLTALEQQHVNQVHAIKKGQPKTAQATSGKKPSGQKLSWLSLLLLLIVLGIGAGLGWQEYQQQRVAHYNDEIVALLENAVTGFEQVLLGLIPYGKGQAVNTQAVQQHFAQTLQALQQAHQQIQHMDVPQAASCTDFQRASLDFLAYQMREGKRIAKILDYIAAHNPGTQQDILVLRKNLHRIGREESQYQQALQQAQEAMAQQFQVILQ